MNVPMDWGVFAFAAGVTLVYGRCCSGLRRHGWRRERGEQQFEGERADHDAAAQRIGREGIVGFPDCAFDAAGGRRGIVFADADCTEPIDRGIQDRSPGAV